MSDLERAYALVHSDPERIEAALAAARREGEEAEAHRAKIVRELDIAAFRAALADMRERAAVLEAALRKIASLDKHSGSSLRTRAASEIAREALRALPFTPEAT